VLGRRILEKLTWCDSGHKAALLDLQMTGAQTAWISLATPRRPTKPDLGQVLNLPSAIAISDPVNSVGLVAENLHALYSSHADAWGDFELTAMQAVIDRHWHLTRPLSILAYGFLGGMFDRGEDTALSGIGVRGRP
jgi:hypothetical protein